jgi:hypothetical protein
MISSPSIAVAHAPLRFSPDIGRFQPAASLPESEVRLRLSRTSKKHRNCQTCWFYLKFLNEIGLLQVAGASMGGTMAFSSEVYDGSRCKKTRQNMELEPRF